MVVFRDEEMTKIFNFAVANYSGVRSSVSDDGDLGFTVPFQGVVDDFHCHIYLDNVNTNLHVLVPFSLVHDLLPNPFPEGTLATDVNIKGLSVDMSRMSSYAYIHHFDTTDDDILSDVAHILCNIQYRCNQEVCDGREFYSDMIPVLDLRSLPL